ncbi:lipopolysaccharide biosynthesis protein [uncultured Sphingomonas sp.]|uniref:lipopolysaccharide biosynthesis protein n=1 Tax=uncultured Sphingomonas sp. TaxID=158754 RepID=UPI0025FC0817|nr:lipopolysaccharide biosynthesis protein [uncultured Sphingomonas sp.]
MKTGDGERLTRRTAAGAGILIGTRLVTRGIDFVALILLARLLTPADFGLVAIAMTLVLICEAVSDLPIAQAVVRMPVIDQDHLDTAFTVSVMRGGAIAALLCLAAWPFAILYNDVRLVGLVSALALAPALRGICNPRFAIFARNLDFRRETLVEVGTKLCSLTVAAGLAWTTRSYWAIAAGTIAGPLAMNLIAYAMAPWSPRFTLREWPAFTRFLGWASGGQVLNAISWQVDQLALGRFVARQELGLFTIASTLAFLPFQIVIQQISRPLVAGFAMVQDDPARQANAYQLGTATLVALCLPVIVGMSMLAGPLTMLALGPQWGETATVLRWLALATIPALFVAPAGALAMAINRTDTGFRLSSLEFAVRLPLTCAAAMQAGVPGVIAARATATLLITLYAMRLVRSMIGLSMRRQMLGSWRAMLSSIVMAAALHPLWPAGPLTAPPLLIAGGLMASAAWGATVYVLSMLLLWRASGRPAGAEARLVAFGTAMVARLGPPQARPSA